ncbi:MAG: ABC transporter ATP-binding protein [Minwuia sp.]|uniref:ABC transporter ATP-binding protein n=1 Tax=Minwuia sp. TaxID=2493630 RepID=UPI003A835B90
MAETPAIRAVDLVKRYGAAEAVRGVGFSVAPRETVGLLGPNGAGKTTTIRMLAGFLAPTAGSIEVGGESVGGAGPGARDMRRRIGYLPEGTPIRRDMTVRDYLSARARIYGLPRARRREMIDRAMERCGIAPRADTLIGRLSKGLKQRAGLAQAILHEPDILILDEPSSGIDPVQIVEVRNLIRELGQSHTIVFSSHVLPEAEQICDRVLVMGRGRILGERRRSDGSEARFVVEAGAPAARLIALLSPLAAGDIEASEADGLTVCRFVLGAETDTARVAETVVGAGIPLQRLTSERDDLEGAFLRLLGEDEAAARAS